MSRRAHDGPADPATSGGSARDRWRARRGPARVLRLVVLLVPVGVAVGVSFAVTRLAPAPLPLLPRAAWFLGVATACGAVAWPVQRLFRRLLPLAALLELSIRFPGPAPNRWAIARTATSLDHLEVLANGVPDSTPARAAATILALVASLSRHDRITRGHSDRVKIFTDMIASEMKLPLEDRDRLCWAALVHDVGKLEVPARLLRKPRALTQAEWADVRMHPQIGARLTAPLAQWLGPFAAVTLEHHERFDGTGYPRGLKGSQITLGARIVGVADAFEVMTAARPYKRAISRAAALREVVRCSGTHFDPVVVRALLAVSTPRLRRALGPVTWVGQLPVVATAPVSGLPGVAGQVVRGTGSMMLGGVAASAVVVSTGIASVAPPAQALTPVATIGAPMASSSGTTDAAAGNDALSAAGSANDATPGVATPGSSVHADAAGNTVATGGRAAEKPVGSSAVVSTATGGVHAASPTPDPAPTSGTAPEQADGVTGVVGGTLGAVGDAVDAVTGGLGNTVGGIAGTVGDAIGGTVGDTVGGTGSAVGGAVGDLGGAVAEVLDGAVGGLLGGKTGRTSSTGDTGSGSKGGLLGGLFGR